MTPKDSHVGLHQSVITMVSNMAPFGDLGSYNPVRKVLSGEQ